MPQAFARLRSPQRGVLAMVLFAIVFFGLFGAPAFAYDEAVPPTGRTCPECHGPNSVAPEGAVDAGRKGPHGGYTTGTARCETCHTLHGPSPYALALVEVIDDPYGPTMSDTCLVCHDGTGGQGVYGAIYQRTGVDPGDPAMPGGAHRLDVGAAGIMVPGGNADGSDAMVQFSGRDGGLSCGDCHSPHDGGTVEPFVGDRIRTNDDTTSATATNRLLRKQPTSSIIAVSDYGSDWCESCHKGRHSQGGNSGNHSAADTVTAPGWFYDNVERLNVAGTARDAVPGPLGGNNRGYIMPEPRGSQAYPICQQCHEDARDVGNVTQFQLDASETFSVSLDGGAAGNPQFQNFPHEAYNDGMLVEDPTVLCTNCHV